MVLNFPILYSQYYLFLFIIVLGHIFPFFSSCFRIKRKKQKQASFNFKDVYGSKTNNPNSTIFSCLLASISLVTTDI